METGKRKIEDYARETEGLSMKELISLKAVEVSKGYYIEDMPLKRERPLDYEIFYAELLEIAKNARIIIRNVAGSPMLREGGECIAGIYTPEGDAAVLSIGVLLHIYSMSECIRFMVNNDYEENPGIKEGDFFFNNDPHCGGQHSQDQFILTPVFYKGRLVAWVGGMSHEMETGATGPGGYDPKATSRYYEGLLLSAMKFGTNDTMNSDYRILVEHSTRDATYWLMDAQAKMSGCIFMRNEIKRLIEKYGLEFYLEAVQEIIEDGRRAAQEKIRNRFLPGTYRARGYVEAFVPEVFPTKIMQTSLEMKVDKEGVLWMNMEGTSPETPWCGNGTEAACKGTFFCALAQCLVHDCMFNAGSYHALRFNIPKGCFYSCSLQAGTSKYIGNAGALLIGMLFEATSRMYYIGCHFDEVMASCTATCAEVFAGRWITGIPYAGILMEMICKGTGASATHDGVDVHHIYFNPEGDLTDTEINERTWAIKILGRNQRMDGGGVGKYRGGVGLDSVYFFLNNKGKAEGSFGADNYYVPATQGLMGGYPTARRIYNQTFNTNIKELFDSGKEYPTWLGIEAIEGRGPTLIEKMLEGGVKKIAIETAQPVFPIQDYDLFEHAVDGSAGFGDPLERDPQLIIKDMQKGLTSPRMASEVCGAVIEKTGPRQQDLKCNYEKTAELRRQMKEKRKKQGIPAAEYIIQQRKRILKGDLPLHCIELINSLLEFSPSWAKWYREQWGLTEDFRAIPLTTKKEIDK